MVKQKRTKKPTCKKATAYACGFSCITMTKACRQGLEGQSIEIANGLVALVEKASRSQAQQAQRKNAFSAYITDGSPLNSKDEKVIVEFWEESANEFAEKKVKRLLAENPGMLEAEAIGFAAYIGEYYSDMNRMLYSSDKTLAEYAPEGNQLNAALAKACFNAMQKMPKATAEKAREIATQGSDGNLHRYMNLDEKQIKNLFGKLKEGDEFTFDAFGSTTTENIFRNDLDIVDNDILGLVMGSNVHIVISNINDQTLAKNGAIHADAWKNSLNEREILFQPGTRTRVIRKTNFDPSISEEGDTGSVTRIYLELT